MCVYIIRVYIMLCTIEFQFIGLLNWANAFQIQFMTLLSTDAAINNVR